MGENHTGANGPIAYLFQRITKIEHEMLIKDTKINKIESDLLLSECRVRKLEEDIKLIKNETLDMEMNTDKQSLFSFNKKKEENNEEYGEKIAHCMKTEKGFFSRPIKRERVELEEFLMEGSDSEKGDVKNNGDQSTKVKEANLKDECTVKIKKEFEGGLLEEATGEDGKAEEVQLAARGRESMEEVFGENKQEQELVLDQIEVVDTKEDVKRKNDSQSNSLPKSKKYKMNDDPIQVSRKVDDPLNLSGHHKEQSGVTTDILVQNPDNIDMQIWQSIVKCYSKEGAVVNFDKNTKTVVLRFLNNFEAKCFSKSMTGGRIREHYLKFNFTDKYQSSKKIERKRCTEQVLWMTGPNSLTPNTEYFTFPMPPHGEGIRNVVYVKRNKRETTLRKKLIPQSFVF